MLRAHIEAGDEIGHQTGALLKSGKLVPDHVVNELAKRRMVQPDCRSGVILDGYPRTLNQAQFLLSFLAANEFRPAVVHLVVDHDEIVARLSGRRQCPVCGTLYSVITNPPKIAGICDRDGAELVTREDDREPVIRQRLREYESQTRPILNFFASEGTPILQVDGSTATPDQIASEILNRLADTRLVQMPARRTSVPVGFRS